MKKLIYVVCLAFLSLTGSNLVAEPQTQATTQEKRINRVVNVNQATAEEIAFALDGVGMKKAKAIVIYRDENGKFDALDQLLAVKGIGNRIIEVNKERIIF